MNPRSHAFHLHVKTRRTKRPSGSILHVHSFVFNFGLFCKIIVIITFLLCQADSPKLANLLHHGRLIVRLIRSIVTNFGRVLSHKKNVSRRGRLGWCFGGIQISGDSSSSLAGNARLIPSFRAATFGFHRPQPIGHVAFQFFDSINFVVVRPYNDVIGVGMAGRGGCGECGTTLHYRRQLAGNSFVDGGAQFRGFVQKLLGFINLVIAFVEQLVDFPPRQRNPFACWRSIHLVESGSPMQQPIAMDRK
mmetsp:Transcript_15334/g.42474  ORF Transcript_15334/g.42474 Transcript_15334/m.42474 type:complete len:248 (+) Transcript_15334:297-1040(+)